MEHEVCKEKTRTTTPTQEARTLGLSINRNVHILSDSWLILLVFYFLLIHLDAVFGKSHKARGTLKITAGAMYNPNLQDKLSADFKILAFDLQQMVGDCLFFFFSWFKISKHSFTNYLPKDT